MKRHLLFLLGCSASLLLTVPLTAQCDQGVCSFTYINRSGQRFIGRLDYKLYLATELQKDEVTRKSVLQYDLTAVKDREFELVFPELAVDWAEDAHDDTHYLRISRATTRGGDQCFDMSNYSSIRIDAVGRKRLVLPINGYDTCKGTLKFPLAVYDEQGKIQLDRPLAIEVPYEFILPEAPPGYKRSVPNPAGPNTTSNSGSANPDEAYWSKEILPRISRYRRGENLRLDRYYLTYLKQFRPAIHQVEAEMGLENYYFKEFRKVNRNNLVELEQFKNKFTPPIYTYNRPVSTEMDAAIQTLQPTPPPPPAGQETVSEAPHSQKKDRPAKARNSKPTNPVMLVAVLSALAFIGILVWREMRKGW